MDELPTPERHYISAALGWMDLGLPAEAAGELDRVRPEFRERPDVLEVRWLCAARLSDWDGALDLARCRIRVEPMCPSGWLHQAYALRRVAGGGIKAAWDALLPARDRFRDEPIIPYNLSCYACQLGQLDAARHWLRQAMRLRPSEIRQMALMDEDLRPLWEELREDGTFC